MSTIARTVIVTAFAVMIGAPLIAQERLPRSEPNTVTAETMFDPSRDDARIVAVLDAVRKRDEAMRTGDLVTVRKYMPPNMIVNAPINRVSTAGTCWPASSGERSPTTRMGRA